MKLLTFKMFILFGITFFCCQTVSLAQEKFASNFSICNLPVPTTIKKASANFSVSYSFELKADGSPVNIKKIVDKYIGQEKVADCISNWKFSDIPENERFIAMFRWVHGKGWTELAIVAQKVSYVIKVKDGVGY
jgi:hypothetical protein